MMNPRSASLLTRALLLVAFAISIGSCGARRPASTTVSSTPQAIQPVAGHLLIVGGGQLGPEITQRFVALAGGPDALIVVIPTADEREPAANAIEQSFLYRAGARSLTLLHTRDRVIADAESFVAPLQKARGVWIVGGRQWRLVDAYLNTRTQKELLALLDRGGVIGGTSAGATIQGSYLVRGAREGNTIMMAKGYEEGFGFLRSVAVDQHLIRRKREDDLLTVIDSHPELLGIGIDESTAIVVQGDRFDVIGESKVAIYDHDFGKGLDGKRYYFLSPGVTFDLKTRKVVPRP